MPSLLHEKWAYIILGLAYVVGEYLLVFYYFSASEEDIVVRE
jgi:hypothetical protein